MMLLIITLDRHPIISSHYISSRSFRSTLILSVHFVPHHFVPKSFRPKIISSQDQFLSHTYCLLPFCTTLILAHTLCPCTSPPVPQVIYDHYPHPQPHHHQNPQQHHHPQPDHHHNPHPHPHK